MPELLDLGLMLTGGIDPTQAAVLGQMQQMQRQSEIFNMLKTKIEEDMQASSAINFR